MGRRNFFVFCIIVFTVASFLCGAAPSLPMLLLFRVMQGAGGGGMQPMAQAIMADSFEPHKRGQAFALYGLVAVLAPSIGPTLGGWITDNFSWRWIFFINIPVGILAFILVTRLVDDPPWIKPDRSPPAQHGLPGPRASSPSPWAACRSCSTRAKRTTGSPRASSASSRALFVVGMVGLVVWEWRQKDPLINLQALPLQELRHLLLPDDAGGRRAERQHRAAAAVHAATAGLYRHHRRPGADGRRHRAGDRDAPGRLCHRQGLRALRWP